MTAAESLAASRFAPRRHPTLSPIEIAAVVGRCRGYALNSGALAVLCATSESAAELASLAKEFHQFRRSFIDIVNQNEQITAHLANIDDLAAPLRTCLAFHGVLSALPDDVVVLSRSQAKELARQSRQDVLPAIYRIIDRLEADEAALADARINRTREKAALVDGMLTEMGRIGRMIGLISINASVEAARTGGTSGRAFQVIAEEVRDLARQSSALLDQTKARLADDRRRASDAR